MAHDSISEHSNSKIFLGEHAPRPPYSGASFACLPVGVFSKNIMTLENMPIHLIEEPLNLSPIGVFSSDYGSHSIAQ